MNIKKSRIIQIIKEEIQKLTEDDGSDDGMAPVSLTRTTQAPAPSDDLAQIEIQINALEKEIATLQTRLAHRKRRRDELAGEEPEAPDFTDETDPQDETELAPIPAPALARYRKKMGEE